MLCEMLIDFVKTANDLNVAYRGEHVLEDRSGDGVLREPRDVSSKTVASQSQPKDHERCEAHNATKAQIRPAASGLAWFHCNNCVKLRQKAGWEIMLCAVKAERAPV